MYPCITSYTKWSFISSHHFYIFGKCTLITLVGFLNARSVFFSFWLVCGCSLRLTPACWRVLPRQSQHPLPQPERPWDTSGQYWRHRQAGRSIKTHKCTETAQRHLLIPSHSLIPLPLSSNIPFCWFYCEEVCDLGLLRVEGDCATGTSLDAQIHIKRYFTSKPRSAADEFSIQTYAWFR